MHLNIAFWDKVSGLDNNEYSQFYSLLWRLLLCVGWLSFDRSSGAINPARDVILILKFWHFREMFNVWKRWLKYSFVFLFPCSQKTLMDFIFLNTVFKKRF